MKAKELIRELQKYDGDSEIQIEISVYDAVLHSKAANMGMRNDDLWVGEAKMRDSDRKPLIIIGGYACNDGRKE